MENYPQNSDVPGGALASVNLGDIVTLPDGQTHTVRSRVDLPASVGTMSGFIICGEMVVLASIPNSIHSPVGLYSPLAVMPEEVKRGSMVSSGLASYLSPHLPIRAGGLGEISWAIIDMPGSLDPVVITTRSNEHIIWLKSQTAHAGSLFALKMPLSEEDARVIREAATVMPHYVPHYAPVPEKETVTTNS